MLLTGTFYRSVDEKQRVSIPKRIRAALETQEASALYLAPGTDGSLAIYTEEEFEKLAQRLAEASPTGRNVLAFSRLFYAKAQAVEMDSQGRIRVPPELAQIASLRKEVVLVGVRDHLELWDREHWEQYTQQKQEHYDEIAEKAFTASQ
jgi:MraZ protein